MGGPPVSGYAPPGPCGKVKNERLRTIPPVRRPRTETQRPLPPIKGFCAKAASPRRIGGFLLRTMNARPAPFERIPDAKRPASTSVRPSRCEEARAV